MNKTVLGIENWITIKITFNEKRNYIYPYSNQRKFEMSLFILSLCSVKLLILDRGKCIQKGRRVVAWWLKLSNVEQVQCKALVYAFCTLG